MREEENREERSAPGPPELRHVHDTVGDGGKERKKEGGGANDRDGFI